MIYGIIFLLIFFFLQILVLLCCVAAGNDPVSQALSDKEQMEFLASWQEQKKKRA